MPKPASRRAAAPAKKTGASRRLAMMNQSARKSGADPFSQEKESYTGQHEFTLRGEEATTYFEVVMIDQMSLVVGGSKEKGRELVGMRIPFWSKKSAKWIDMPRPIPATIDPETLEITYDQKALSEVTVAFFSKKSRVSLWDVFKGRNKEYDKYTLPANQNPKGEDRSTYAPQMRALVFVLRKFHMAPDADEWEITEENRLMWMTVPAGVTKDMGDVQKKNGKRWFNPNINQWTAPLFIQVVPQAGQYKHKHTVELAKNDMDVEGPNDSLNPWAKKELMELTGEDPDDFTATLGAQLLDEFEVTDEMFDEVLNEMLTYGLDIESVETLFEMAPDGWMKGSTKSQAKAAAASDDEEEEEELEGEEEELEDEEEELEDEEELEEEELEEEEEEPLEEEPAPAPRRTRRPR